MITLSVAVLAQALASTPSVRAMQPPTPSTPSVIVTHEWYGYQTLAMDMPGLTVSVVGATTGKNELLVAGLCLYALGPPLVHEAHGRVLTGLIDFGVRVGVVYGAGIFFGLFFPFENEGPGLKDAAFVGFGITLAGMSLYDALVLSSITEVHYPDHLLGRDLWSLAPLIAPRSALHGDGKGGAAPTFGVRGTF